MPLHTPRSVLVRRVLLGALVLLLISLLVIAISHVDTRALLQALVVRVEALGWAGPLLMFVAVMLVIPLMVPNTPLELASGLIFPLWLAIPLLIAAETAGAAVAFLIARRGAGRRFEAIWERDGKLQRLIHAFERQAWRGVALTRVILMFPFKLSNWAFGFSRIGSRDFILGTALGIIPRIVAVAYLGSIAGGLAGEPGPQGPARTIVLAGGIGLSVAGLTVMALASRRVLARAEAEQQDEDMAKTGSAPGAC